MRQVLSVRDGGAGAYIDGIEFKASAADIEPAVRARVALAPTYPGTPRVGHLDPGLVGDGHPVCRRVLAHHSQVVRPGLDSKAFRDATRRRFAACCESSRRRPSGRGKVPSAGVDS